MSLIAERQVTGGKGRNFSGQEVLIWSGYQANITRFYEVRFNRE